MCPGGGRECTIVAVPQAGLVQSVPRIFLLQSGFHTWHPLLLLFLPKVGRAELRDSIKLRAGPGAMVATLLSLLLVSLTGSQAVGQVIQGSPLELLTLVRQDVFGDPLETAVTLTGMHGKGRGSLTEAAGREGIFYVHLERVQGTEKEAMDVPGRGKVGTQLLRTGQA